MSLAHLSRITKLIDDGCPLFAILTANELFDAKDPLRQALVRRARVRIDERPTYRNLTRAIANDILDGARASTLPARWREILGAAGARLTDKLPLGLPSPRSYRSSRRVATRRGMNVRIRFVAMTGASYGLLQPS